MKFYVLVTSKSRRNKCRFRTQIWKVGEEGVAIQWLKDHLLFSEDYKIIFNYGLKWNNKRGDFEKIIDTQRIRDYSG